jgi:hypothetical protein
VYFVARERTDGQVRAVRHIRAMNALARQRGLLLDTEADSSRLWRRFLRTSKLAQALAGAIAALRASKVAQGHARPPLRKEANAAPWASKLAQALAGANAALRASKVAQDQARPPLRKGAIPAARASTVTTPDQANSSCRAEATETTGDSIVAPDGRREDAHAEPDTTAR